MKFAVDACVAAQLIVALRRAGADVVSTAGRPAMPDPEVLFGANAIDRVLVTNDKDFGELVFRDQLSAVGVVLVRDDLSSSETCVAIATLILDLPHFGRGSFTVIEQSGVRTRPLPERPV